MPTWNAKEPGVGRGNYSTNAGGHSLNEYGITDRQKQIIDTYIAHNYSLADTGRALGISRVAVYYALRQIGKRLNVLYSEHRWMMYHIIEAYQRLLIDNAENGDNNDVS